MPPKAKRAQSPESRFLFVNEDASTVNRTTKDTELDRTKQSHVQRQNFARRRRLREGSTSIAQRRNSESSALASSSAERGSPSQGFLSHGADYVDILHRLDLGGSTQSPTSPQPGTIDPRLFSDPRTSQISPSKASLPRENAFGTSHAYQPGHFFDTPSPNYDTTSTTRRPLSSASSTSHSVGILCPPVVTAQQQLAQWAPPLMQYYNTVILPEQFWKDVRKRSMGQIRHAASIHADMQACMAEPCHMYAFLSSTAAHMIEREGRLLIPGASTEDLQRVPTFFKTKAIRALRGKLSGGHLDQRTAMDVHRLYATMIYCDDYEAAEPHFQALLSMVETLGGLSTFDDYQLELLIQLDCYAALKRMEVPRLLATWDPGRLPEDEEQIIELHGQSHTQAASGFERQWQAWQLSDVLYDTYVDLVQVLDMSSYLSDLPYYVPEQTKWLCWRTYALLHRLLSIPLNYELDEMSEIFRIATIYWVATSSCPVQGRKWAAVSNHALKSRLESMDLQYLWNPHTDCLLWIAVFGGICTFDEENLDFFVNLARDATVELGIKVVHQIETLFASLLYDPDSQQGLLATFGALVWPDSSQ